MAEYGNPLSERELEILQLVATGAANKEVAYQLGISTNTVKVHLRNIFTKLGAESRTEMTMMAVRDGLVVVPSVAPSPSPIPVEVPELGLSWFRRSVLLAAVLLSIGVGILSWPRSPNLGEQGFFPPDGVFGPGEVTELSTESSWDERVQMPTRRAWFGLAVYGEQLYAIGGEGPEGATGAVEVYDTVQDAWARRAEKPSPAAYVTASTLNGRIWVPGGCREGFVPSDQLAVYDPIADTWEAAAPLPRPLCGYATAVHDGKLYLFGGTDGSESLATTYVYDPSSDQWQERAPMDQGRALAAATTVYELIYVVGGYRSGKEVATCSIYDPLADTWAVCAPLTMARGGLGLVTLVGQLYAIGGGGWGGYLGFNERSIPGEGRWLPVETPLTGRWHGAGVALVDLTIYAVGGLTNEYESQTLAFEPMPYRVFIPAAEH